MKIKVNKVSITKEEIEAIIDGEMDKERIVTNQMVDDINRNLKHYIQNSIWFGNKKMWAKPLWEWIYDGVIGIIRNIEDEVEMN